MKVSLNTLKQFTEIDGTVDELVKKINAQLGTVEEVTDLGARYKDALIVRVVNCEDHPNADKLRVCMIDDGGVVDDVERDDNNHVRVVCGAPNARGDMYAIWLPPSSTVPSSYNDKQPFVLEARELRGIVSNGMLASAKELAIGDSHDGIVEIDEHEWSPRQSDIKPGASFAAVFGLDDTIIDIENKMFTHRPDCFGQIGIAREVAGIHHKKFVSPSWYLQHPETSQPDNLPLTVKSDDGAAWRFMATVMSNVIIKPSPLWLQTELVRMGSKPINNIVDVTNYVMLLTGQPLHAYDYDKIGTATLEARFARDGEVVGLLNSKTIKLTSEDVVITDGNRPIGLAGVMGGADTEVDETTKNIILECATFDMYAVRRTSMRHGIFTDAVTRYNKGQSPYQNPHILSLAISLIKDLSSEAISGHIHDLGHVVHHSRGQSYVSPNFINERLGILLSKNEIEQYLRNVEFEICDGCENSEHTDDIHYTVPFWRTDIQIKEDIVEEIGRLHGYDRLVKTLPRRDIQPVEKNENRLLKDAIRSSLSKNGANELLTYSFVHERVLTAAAQDTAQAFKLKNALSPDLQYYRLSVLPSLLDKVHLNIKSGYDEFVLYEIGKSHSAARHALNDDGLPKENELVDIIYASKAARSGAPYYRVSRLITRLCEDLGITYEFRDYTPDEHDVVTAPFEAARSALLYQAHTDTVLGIVGELKSSVVSSFKLPTYNAAASLDINKLLQASKTGVQYHSLSRYPGTWQDICFRVSEHVSYADLSDAVGTALDESTIETSYRPLDIYQAAESKERQITFRIQMVDQSRTITQATVQATLTYVIEQAKNRCDATVV